MKETETPSIITAQNKVDNKAWGFIEIILFLAGSASLLGSFILMGFNIIIAMIAFALGFIFLALNRISMKVKTNRIFQEEIMKQNSLIIEQNKEIIEKISQS